MANTEARALQLVAGAQVTDVVANSPAANGDLQEGDIITAVNGVKIDDENLLEASLSVLTPGENVVFSITRNGQSVTSAVTPAILE